MEILKQVSRENLEIILTFLITSIGAWTIRRIEKRKIRKRWEKDNYFKK
jgi:ABC-type nickel/cobalt efflux system permease component RcnA